MGLCWAEPCGHRTPPGASIKPGVVDCCSFFKNFVTFFSFFVNYITIFF